VEVDHSFSVKGVGEVILGFVKKGIVKRYDDLHLLLLDLNAKKTRIIGRGTT
jgi:selenocysteine-specific translation elongation factor